MHGQKRRRRHAGLWRGRRLRTVIEVASLVGVFTLILYAGVGYMGIGGMTGFRGGGGGFGVSDDGPPPPDGQAFRIGSILLMPPSGKTCEERHFDNHTGRIVGDAMVNCEAKLLQLLGAPPPPPEPAPGQPAEKQNRMRAVLGGFKR